MDLPRSNCGIGIVGHSTGTSLYICLLRCKADNLSRIYRFVVYQTKKMANYKAPSVFKEDMSYEAWEKELAIWATFTDLDKKK